MNHPSTGEGPIQIIIDHESQSREGLTPRRAFYARTAAQGYRPGNACPIVEPRHHWRVLTHGSR